MYRTIGKDYLGDSVYIEDDSRDPSMICLTTDNGTGPEETIYLEREIIEALMRYAKRKWGEE